MRNTIETGPVSLTLVGDEVLRKSGFSPELERAAQTAIANHADKIDTTSISHVAEGVEQVHIRLSEKARRRLLWEDILKRYGKHWSSLNGTQRSLVKATYEFEKREHAFSPGLTIPENVGANSHDYFQTTIRSPYSPIRAGGE